MTVDSKAKKVTRRPHASWHDMHLMAVWDQRYAELVEFKERFGHCIVPQHWEENPKLGLWVMNQRVARKKGKLPPEKVDLLDKLGFVWIAKVTRNQHAKWYERFAELKKFKAKYGHPNVPSNSIEYSTLARWQNNQRTLRKQCKLPKWKEELLSNLGLEWGKSKKPPKTFEEYFEELIKFKRTHGHCWVKMGESLWKDLARWMAATRAKKLAGQLSFERFIALANLGFSWVKLRKTKDSFLRTAYWQMMIELLKAHKEKYGNCDFNAHQPDSNDLVEWSKRMRYLMASGELPIDCQVKLNSIGFVWILDREEALKLFRDKFSSRAKNRPVSLVPALDEFAQKKKEADDLWNVRFSELYDYRKKHESLVGLAKDNEARVLFRWFQRQLSLIRVDELEKEKYQTLLEFGFLRTLPSTGRGGRRLGAGRKKGSGRGPISVTKSISLTKEEWDKLKELSGSISVSKFIRKTILRTEQ